MTSPLSIRFDPELLERLRRKARSTPGASPSGLAQRMVDEGLRMAEHPGMVFKDGPSGRRAALQQGPDVWEVITALQQMDERGHAAVEAAAELLNLSTARIGVAVRYYAVHSAEIDQEMIAMAEADSLQAEAEWEATQRLLQ